MRALVLVTVWLCVLGCRRPSPRPGDFAEFNWHTTLDEQGTKREYHSVVRFDVVAVDEGSLTEVITVLPGGGHEVHHVLRSGLQVRLETAGSLPADALLDRRDEGPHRVQLAEGEVRCDFREDGCVVKGRATPTQGIVQWASSSTHGFGLVREGHEPIARALSGTPLFVAGDWVEDDRVINGHHQRVRRTWDSRAGYVVITSRAENTVQRGRRLLPTVAQLLASSFDSVRAGGAPVKWRGFDARSDGVHVRMAPQQALPAGMPLEVFVDWLWTAPMPGGYATGEVVDWAGAPSGERDE